MGGLSPPHPMKSTYKLMNLLKDDKELIESIEYARKFGWLLNYGVDQGLIEIAKLLPFFKIISRAINVPYSDWVYLTIEEIKS